MRTIVAMALCVACGLAFPLVPTAVFAQVYRCTAGNGAVSYQDHACARGQAQKMIDVPSRPPPGYVPPPASSTSPPASAMTTLPAPTYVSPPPPLPLPLMYACVGYVNGKRYLTRNPPGPYLAPLGVMGYPPQTLSQVYGAEGASRISVPALAPKVRIGGPPIAAGMTEVQDPCAPASHAEVCGYVQREYDENHRKLRMAMPREQPPYEQREQQLAAQLKNC
ncbi:MAG: DUF4124 domain-containing protein [Rhodanobacteraceae bacterium]